MNTQQMRNRISRLLLVRDGIDQELTALRNGLRMAGDVDDDLEPRRGPGRPTIPSLFTYTEEEARAAHSLWVQGVHTDWSRDGERAYQRESKRRRTQRKAS